MSATKIVDALIFFVLNIVVWMHKFAIANIGTPAVYNSLHRGDAHAHFGSFTISPCDPNARLSAKRLCTYGDARMFREPFKDELVVSQHPT